MLQGLVMNSCVVEFEAFQGINGELIIKELAIVDVDHGLCHYVLFKPPYGRTRLNRKYKRVADWLQHKLHGISWSEGVVDYTLLPSTIHDVCSTYSTVFTKGLEKARFLSAFHRDVVDLNDINAPTYDYSIIGDTSLRCNVTKHGYTNDQHKCVYKCALNKAYFYTIWLRSRFVTTYKRTQHWRSKDSTTMMKWETCGVLQTTPTPPLSA